MRSLSFMFLCSLSFLFSTNYYVETTGTDNSACSQSSPCEHIQTAIDLTVDGDVVMVSPGTYVENILIETAITVQGSDPLSPAMIDGSSPDPSSPNDWNESCVVIRSTRDRTSRISATLQDVKVTGGKGTMVIIDGNKDGDFNDPEDVSKKVGGGIIISNANMTARRLQVVNNGDASTKEGGGIYAAGTGAGVPDNNPNFPPMPGDDERSSIVFEESIFSGNDASDSKTIMVNGWNPTDTTQFINMDFGNAQFDVAYDDNNNELDGVSEYWVKGKDNSTFDFTGGITGEYDAIATDVWVDPLNGVDEENSLGDQNNPFLTIDYAMGMIYPTEDNPVTIHLTEGTFSPTINGEIFPIYMYSNINIVGSGEEETILNAEGSEENQKRLIYINNCQNNNFSNFTIQGGFLKAECGGGIYIENSNPNLMNITIRNNEVQNIGFDDMTTMGVGAGICMIFSDPIFEFITIEENLADYGGGGIYMLFSYAELSNVLINGNYAGTQGGGIFIFFSDVLINNMTISENTAGNKGGGIYMDQSENSMIKNSVIYGNTTNLNSNESIGGGIYMHASNPLIFNTTILDNSSVLGSGIFINVSNPVLTNSIILDNSSESISLYSGSEDPIITYSNIVGGWEGEGEGNIDSDPLLNDDFTLQANSPCIDAGTADLDGDGQDDITDYFGEAPDMGAFEFEGSTMIPGDVTGDGQLNILDVVALVNIVLGNADPIDSGDLNGDGNLNVLDVVALVQIILEG